MVETPYFRGDKSRSIKGIRTSTGVYLNGSGGSDAGKIYRAAMAGALQGKPKTEFVAPHRRGALRQAHQDSQH